MYDGMHMYGMSGRIAYTESVLSIIQDVLSEQHHHHTLDPHQHHHLPQIGVPWKK